MLYCDFCGCMLPCLLMLLLVCKISYGRPEGTPGHLFLPKPPALVIIGNMSTLPLARPILAPSGTCLQMGCHPWGSSTRKAYDRCFSIGPASIQISVVSTVGMDLLKRGVNGLKVCFNGLSRALPKKRMAIEHVWLHMWKWKSGVSILELDLWHDDSINLSKFSILSKSWTNTCYRGKHLSQTWTFTDKLVPDCCFIGWRKYVTDFS